MTEIINLGAVRARRAAALAVTYGVLEDLVKFAVDQAVGYAEMADHLYRITKPADAELAGALARTTRRRMRAKLRRVMRGLNAPCAAVVFDKADEVFHGRLLYLDHHRRQA